MVMNLDFVSFSFLDSPLWQGVGALVAAAALTFGIGLELGKRRNGRLSRAQDDEAWKMFDLSDERGEKEFYDALEKSIRDAKEAIYRSGRGFSRPNKMTYMERLLRAEESALRNGVEIIRIQTKQRMLEEWADAYAQLASRFPNNLFIYADQPEPPLVNVALVDPFGTNPIIQLLFESHETSLRGLRTRGESAIFLYGKHGLSASLAGQFTARVKNLSKMTAEDIRELGASELYFAYGSNMLMAQMEERVDKVRRVGNAILYGWRRRFAVSAPHLKASAVGIEKADNEQDYIEGVLYELPITEMVKLDEIERGGYRRLEIGIKVGGAHKSAWTHVPLHMELHSGTPPSDYLEILIKAAQENNLTGYLEELRVIEQNMKHSSPSTEHRS